MLPFLGLIMSKILPSWEISMKDNRVYEHRNYEEDSRLIETVVEISLSKWELKQLIGSTTATRKRRSKNLSKINERLLEGGRYDPKDIPKYEQIAKSLVWKITHLLELENKLIRKALELGYSLSWIKGEEARRENSIHRSG